MPNMFANCNTEQELEFEYMIRTSPENISWDGELSSAQQKMRFTAINHDYEARAKELRS